jgi:NAD(P)-dependent dehydrogenase (short-subunit alcohol dehydrogenase family)
MERLKGKTALVVGAGSIGPGWGNGKATAVTFAREGAQVFCVDRNGAAAEETVKIIASEGGKAAAFTADASRAGDVEAMAAACLKAYGRIDVLDNNVGIAEMGNVVDVSEASWDHVFAVNLKSAFLAMKHVIPVMERLDHQYLVDRLDPPSRHLLCQLRDVEGRDEPDDAHHRG